MPTISQEGSVYFLNLGDGENRFTLPWITELHAVVQEIAAGQGPRAMVTMATGKFWSNGLDLDWLIAHPDEGADYIDLVQEIFATFIELPLPTVAAIQGHCYAAGALLAMSHDFALMRSDRGFFCLPEVDLGIPFSPGMSSLLQSRML
ncbi:MAG: enoyl-CoA hydratase-related protein, partial [Actinomycetes bacterium]